jgi:hypothetical protein
MHLAALRCFKRVRMIFAESRFQMYERGCIFRTGSIELAFRV